MQTRVHSARSGRGSADPNRPLISPENHLIPGTNRNKNRAPTKSAATADFLTTAWYSNISINISGTGKSTTVSRFMGDSL